MATLREKIQKKEQLMALIASKQSALREEESSMQYADHGAYGQVRDYIRDIERDIARLDYEIADLTGGLVREERPMITASEYVPPQISADDKEELMREFYSEQEAKNKAYVNRFKKSRPANYKSGHYQKFYLKPLSYTVAQDLKKECPAGEVRWDPFIKRWYFSIYMFNGQRFDPPTRHKALMLDTTKNHTAHMWSAEIQKELEFNKADNRPYTVKIHGTAIPNIGGK